MRHETALGSLTRLMCHGARWVGRDQFPAWQEWADECERILRFLESQGKLGDYLARLRGELNQRDGAYSEARVAYWFHRNGFKIMDWGPKATNKPGDLVVRWHNTSPIFVEIKTRTWFAELSEAEKSAGRDKQPRIIHAEVRSYDVDEQVVGAIAKAQPKFADDRPNLLVVCDTMFCSPAEHADPDYLKSVLAKPDAGPIGAMLCFEAVLWSGHRGLEYITLFVENPRAAGQPWAIPHMVAEGLRKANANA